MNFLPFYKVSGTGNDFIVVDESAPEFAPLWARRFAQRSRREVAVEWCRRHHSVGADGVVFLKRSGVARVTWDFYNADGSCAEMCGNAARCVGLVCHQLICPGEQRIEISTGAGVVVAQIDSHDRVVVDMPEVKAVAAPQKFQRQDHLMEVEICDSGVPHAVAVVESLEPVNSWRGVARSLRYPQELGSQGANVTLVEICENFVRAVTYERGVEDFTLACGTGAVAACWRVRKAVSWPDPVRVRMPGGELTVSLKPKGAQTWSAQLGGEAEIVYRGEI